MVWIHLEPGKVEVNRISRRSRPLRSRATASVWLIGNRGFQAVRGRRLELFDDEHTAENIAANAETLNDFSDNLYPETGDAHTIGKAIAGGDPSKLFSDGDV